MLVVRRLLGATTVPRGARTAATAAGFLGLLRSFPFVRNGLRKLLGRDLADTVAGTASLLTMTVAGSYLGLILLGVEGALDAPHRDGPPRRLAALRAALADQAGAEPGAVVRVEAGDRPPFPARVIEGTGTAIGSDGLPLPLAPGGHVPAGAVLSGGPFVLQLEDGLSFEPEPRPAPPTPTLYHRYSRALGPVALAYAALTAVVTRSLARTFHALLLVNPRPAIIGMEAANLNAAARCCAAG